MPIVRARLTGDSVSVVGLIKAIEGIEGLERMQEVANLATHMRDDSSSAGLSDDTGTDFHNMEMHFASPADADRGRRLVESSARSNNVVAEFVERF